MPKRGVRIGVVGSNQEVYSNAEGAYSITGLTAGRYQVRFIDAQLEDMGYIPNPVERDVIRGEMAFLEYFTPSMGDVLLEACEGVERERGSVLLAGSVIDRRDRPVANAQVRVVWEGYSAAGGGNLERIRDLTESTSGFSTVTNQSGFFKFCGVPAGQRLTLQASVENAHSDEVGFTISGGQTGRMTVLTINAR